MNDELSNDIKKKLMLSLTIELQDHNEKVFRNVPVSPSCPVKFTSLHFTSLDMT